MKTLLHFGFGLTQVNQMTYEPMYSAQTQSVRVKEKISFGPKCIFYPYFRVKSLRFEL